MHEYGIIWDYYEVTLELLWVSGWVCPSMPQSKFRLHRRFAELTFSFGAVADATGQGPDLLSSKVKLSGRVFFFLRSLINIDPIE